LGLGAGVGIGIGAGEARIGAARSAIMKAAAGCIVAMGKRDLAREQTNHDRDRIGRRL
jgi:hypothetical protein